MWVAIWWQWVCGCSNFLSQIGFKFWFCFEFLLWVSMDWRSAVIAWWFGDRRRRRGGLERWRWWILFLSFRFSLSLTPILSLKLDVGFSFALNFCCGYWCQIYGGGGGGLLCCWWGWVHCGFTQVAIDVGGDLVAVGLWVCGCSNSLSQIGLSFAFALIFVVGIRVWSWFCICFYLFGC